MVECVSSAFRGPKDGILILDINLFQRNDNVGFMFDAHFRWEFGTNAGPYIDRTEGTFFHITHSTHKSCGKDLLKLNGEWIPSYFTPSHSSFLCLIIFVPLSHSILSPYPFSTHSTHQTLLGLTLPSLLSHLLFFFVWTHHTTSHNTISIYSNYYCK
jgi:hypothetical protein